MNTKSISTQHNDQLVQAISLKYLVISYQLYQIHNSAVLTLFIYLIMFLYTKEIIETSKTE